MISPSYMLSAEGKAQAELQKHVNISTYLPYSVLCYFDEFNYLQNWESFLDRIYFFIDMAL
jgi:hypothetical protein